MWKICDGNSCLTPIIILIFTCLLTGSLAIMTKSLTQINFEFSENEIKEITPAAATVKASPTAEPEKNSIEIKKDKNEINELAAPVLNTIKRGRRSLKEAGLTSDLIQVPEDEILFQKQYYAIGEVAVMFGENQSLIRYWETEFDILHPRKNRKGDRFFRPVDIKNLVLIYDLLRLRKFTIEGAKDYLKKNKNAEETFALIQSLEKIKAFFLELKASL